MRIHYNALCRMDQIVSWSKVKWIRFGKGKNMTGTTTQVILVKPEEGGAGVYSQELRHLASFPNMDVAGEAAVAIADMAHVGVAKMEDGQAKPANGQAKGQQSPAPAATTVAPRNRVIGVADKIRELIKAGKDDAQVLQGVLPMYTKAGKKAEDVTPTLKTYIKDLRQQAGKK